MREPSYFMHVSLRATLAAKCDIVAPERAERLMAALWRNDGGRSFRSWRIASAGWVI